MIGAGLINNCIVIVEDLMCLTPMGGGGGRTEAVAVD